VDGGAPEREKLGAAEGAESPDDGASEAPEPAAGAEAGD
jgi:hypothetical protein